jgi:opacity protein-like surface antigen
MSRFTSRFLMTAMLGGALAAPAMAQSEPDKGIYAVARVGGTIGSEAKIDDASSFFRDKTKYKAGITGQIGGGYDFGMFRLEQTIGYSSIDLNGKKAATGGFDADGRSRMFSTSVAGYIDIPLHAIIVPYVGGGVGIARVDSRLSRVSGTTGVGSSYSGKDWGMMFHGDVGVGIEVAPKTTVEVGGRYTRVSGLKYDGQSGTTDASFKPKLSSISATLGVRHIF